MICLRLRNGDLIMLQRQCSPCRLSDVEEKFGMRSTALVKYFGEMRNTYTTIEVL